MHDTHRGVSLFRFSVRCQALPNTKTERESWHDKATACRTYACLAWQEHIPAVTRSSSLLVESCQTCMMPTEVPVTMLVPVVCQAADSTLPLVLGSVLAYCRPGTLSWASKIRKAPSSQATATRCAAPADRLQFHDSSIVGHTQLAHVLEMCNRWVLLFR